MTMSWMGTGVLASVALALTLAEPSAEACSCVGGVLLAPNGTEGLPRNAVVFAFERNWPANRIIELIEPGGETIGLEERSSQTTANGSHLRILEPTKLLAETTLYEVGEKDSFNTRMFTTETHIDKEPPVAPTIESLQLETLNIQGTGHGGGTCFEDQDGWHGRLIPHLSVFDPDTQLVVVEVMNSSDGPTIDIVPMLRHADGFYGELWDHTCLQSPMFALTPGLEICARGIAYDGAGNASEPGDVVCGVVAECGSPDLDDWPRELCLPVLPTMPDAGIADDQAQGAGGCSTSGGSKHGTWMLLLALLAIGRRARARNENPSNLGC
jgi:hypothetical protein